MPGRPADRLTSPTGPKAADSVQRIRPTTARRAKALSRRADSRFRIRRFTARLASSGDIPSWAVASACHTLRLRITFHTAAIGMVRRSASLLP